MEPLKKSPLALAFLGLIIPVVVGAIAAEAIGATKSGRFLEGYATMVEQPFDGLEKAFNWLIFIVFVAAGFITSAVLWTGATVAVALERTSHRLVGEPVSATEVERGSGTAQPAIGEQPNEDAGPQGSSSAGGG